MSQAFSTHRPARPASDPLLKPMAACGLLAAMAIAIAAIGKPAGEVPRFAAAPAAEAASLRFSDAPDGAVVATDAATGREIARIPAGEGGFVRTALRNLAGARRAAGHGGDLPFRLSRLSDSELVLSDPATGRALLLTAFGRTNAEDFGALLKR